MRVMDGVGALATALISYALGRGAASAAVGLGSFPLLLVMGVAVVLIIPAVLALSRITSYVVYYLSLLLIPPTLMLSDNAAPADTREP